jgi:hypothetical protein
MGSALMKHPFAEKPLRLIQEQSRFLPPLTPSVLV